MVFKNRSDRSLFSEEASEAWSCIFGKLSEGLKHDGGNIDLGLLLLFEAAIESADRTPEEVFPSLRVKAVCNCL